ncbi:hypothetical protein V8F06_007834 [Rhypophila decipiens]
MSGHTNDMEALLKSFLPDEMQSTMRSNGISINELIKEMGVNSSEDLEAMIRDSTTQSRALDYGAKAEHVSLDDARRQTEPMRAKILELYGTLGDIVARHEATIQKRWAKKTRGERLLILLRAWPDMPRKHRPDFNAFKDEHGLVNKAKRPQWRAKTLCPTLNQEDLLKPRTLPLLLNSRDRNHPSVFAGTDRMEMTIGLRTFALVQVPRLPASPNTGSRNPRLRLKLFKRQVSIQCLIARCRRFGHFIIRIGRREAGLVGSIR